MRPFPRDASLGGPDTIYEFVAPAQPPAPAGGLASFALTSTEIAPLLSVYDANGQLLPSGIASRTQPGTDI